MVISINKSAKKGNEKSLKRSKLSLPANVPTKIKTISTHKPTECAYRFDLAQNRISIMNLKGSQYSILISDKDMIELPKIEEYQRTGSTQAA